MRASIAILPMILLLCVFLVLFGALKLFSRRRPRLIEPHCAGCDYDLRAFNFINGPPEKCPECGADLNPPGAVVFGKFYGKPVRWPLYVAGGVVLLVLGMWVVVPIANPGGGGGGVVPGPTMPTAQILARLPNTAGQPWDWQELESRLKAGTLSAADLDTAVGALIADFKARPRQPMHWTGSFLKAAASSGQLKSGRLQEIAQAYFAQSIRVETPQTIRTGKPAVLELRDDNPWDFVNLLHVWHLKQVLVDGKPAEPLMSGKKPHPDDLSGSTRAFYIHDLVLPNLAEGKHQISLVFDEGLIAEGQTLRGKAGKPGTKDKWPEPTCTWETTLPLQVAVVPPQQQIVELLTDEAQAPFAETANAIQEVIIRPGNNGPEIIVTWTSQPLRSTILGKMTFTIGGKKVPLWTQRFDGGKAPGQQQYGLSNALPPGNAADLLIEPDAKEAERTNVYRIWGKSIELKNIPLKRFDNEGK